MKKIYGVTVGTPMNPERIAEKIGTSCIYKSPNKPTDESYQYWLDTSVSPATLRYKDDNGVWIAIAGGSGGSTNNAEFKVTNTSGWLSKTVAYGSECDVYLEWSSLEDEIPTGNGTVKIYVGDVVKSVYEEKQGQITVNIDNYLIAGENTVGVEITDIYGNSRKIVFTVSCVKISISSYFDGNVAYTGIIPYSYTPIGAIEKTVHFLVDGEEIDTQTVMVSGREQTFNIPAQSHGNHTFEVYFTGEIDGQPVESEHLFYDLICCEEGNTTPIIACDFNTESVKQFATVSMPFRVYVPLYLKADVTITDNHGYSTSREVDRTVQPFPYKADNVGTTEITFKVGETERVISFEVMENKIDVFAEISNLELYLNAKGRSNQDKTQSPSEWSYGNISADLQNFNFVSDGWQLDDNGDTVLRVSGDARVHIPFNIFATDFRTSGKTIEFEFATKDVLNPNATVVSCWSGNRGIKITAQEALLKSELSEISRQYKENEHIRVTFTVQKKAENRLISLYINGEEAACIQYGEDDDFSQSAPVGISIGSNLCTTDIYCIRIYGNNLSRYQSLDNWIADTQDIEELIERAERNNVFDDYGNVDIQKIHNRNIPYFVVDADKYSDLPKYKGDKKTVNGKYIDPLHPERSFTFYGAEIDVQGTSSQFYSRKNYKIKFENGFTINGVAYDNYQLRETSMPTNTFTFKADVASSEGANNVELVMLYDEICPVKTPPQETDSRVRQGIEGYPCVMFYYDGSNYNFLGKYNFNNDKATEEVFGFAEGDESWEILTNETQMAVFKDDDFTSTYYDTVKKKDLPVWSQTFEARFPEDNTDTTNLNAFVSWLKSTDTTAVDTEEEKQARIDKFRNELANYANVEALIFNYIFTEIFLMVDNRAKNAFPTRFDKDGKFLILPYDYDTAIGINNEGELKFGYWLEDTDLFNGTKVYNGQDSVLYVNLRLAFAEEIMAMYGELRKLDAFSYDAVEKRFEEHQKVWGEAIFNEDAKFKYIDPLVNDGDNTYLEMLQGSKSSQRKWWLYNRFRYLDSKYVAGDNLEDYIMLRPYAVSDITITPYADIYASIKFDNILVQERALRGDGDAPNSYTLKNPLENGNHGVIAIYSASQLASVGDLSGLKVGMANFSMATKLTEVKVGDGAEGYENPNLNTLTIGNLSLLSKLDIRNCTGLSSVVDVSGCANIEEVYAEGSAVTGVKVPNGGILKTLHLPGTVTSLIIQNQPLLTDFVLPTYENISTLRIEGVDYGLFDFESILNAIQPNSRVRLLDIEMDIDTAEEIFSLYDKFDTFRGLDEQGNNLDYAVISGTIRCGTITSNDYAEMVRRYPNIKVEYEHITSNVYFYVEGVWVHTAVVYDGADCSDPIGEFIETPTKAESDTSKFTFDSWDGSLESVTEDRILNAIFTEHRLYTVKFVNDGIVVSETRLCDCDLITAPVNPTKTSTAQYDFSFKGWSLDGSTVVDVAASVDNEDITYYAVYDSILRYYTINFLDYDGSVLKSSLVAYGSVPTCDNPTRDETAQYFYDFDGWTPSVVAVTGETTYMATYIATLRTYTVTWVNEDGTSLLEKDVNVPYGTMPSYDGATPTKQGNAQYTYTFAGWHIDISAVTGHITYKATYTETVNTYTVTWKNADGTVLETDVKVPYGDMPEYNSSTPVKASTAQYDFAFAGWDTAVSEVTGDVVYTATYTQHIRSYTVKFVDYNGTTLKSETLEYGTMPTAPTPTREGYDFTGWDKSVAAVTGEATYTAQYKIKTYTIKFVDYNGTVLSEQTVNHGSMPTVPTPSRTGYNFTGWDSAVSTATANKTYTAQYEVQKFTVTWVIGSLTKTTECAYGTTPTPPYAVGESVVVDGKTNTVLSYSPSIVVVTSNITYTAKVSISGTVTAVPTLCVPKSADKTNAENFIKGTDDFTSTASYSPVYSVFHGFNFEEIRELMSMGTLEIIGFRYSITYYKPGTQSSQGRIDTAFAEDIKSYSSYTDLGDGKKFLYHKGSGQTNYDLLTQVYTQADLPNAFNWIKSNMTAFLNGYTSTSFGVYHYLSFMSISELTLSVDYKFTSN